MPGDSGRQRSLAGYSPWGCIQLDMTQWLNNTTTNQDLGGCWGHKDAELRSLTWRSPSLAKGKGLIHILSTKKLLWSASPEQNLGWVMLRKQKKKKMNASECFLYFKGSDNPRRMPIMKVKMTVWCKCLRAWTLGPGYLGSNPSSATN